jgi:hypothetical protein
MATALPDSCLILQLSNVTVGVDFDPGYPGSYSGHPDSWEPAEPAGIEQLFVLLPSKDQWVKVDPHTVGDLEARVMSELTEGEL